MQRATGKPKKARKRDVLESCVENMGKNIGEMTYTMKKHGYSGPISAQHNISATQQERMTKQDVESIIQEQMKPTQYMLASIKERLESVRAWATVQVRHQDHRHSERRN